MGYVFIGGIPASGKSYLAREIANEIGTVYFGTDDIREKLSKDPELKHWVNFYWDLDEADYYKNTPCEKQWENLTKQSEAFWPTVLEKIKEIKKKHPQAIFEGVNILPHLAAKDLNFSGVYLLGESVDQIFERNKQNPRWGQTEELQRIEAEMFFNCEGKMYQQEAEKYGFKCFSDSNEAKQELLRLLKS